jgi:hypothetical protein
MFHRRYRFFTIDIQEAPPLAIPEQRGFARSELAARYETRKMKVQASVLLSLKKKVSLVTVAVYSHVQFHEPILHVVFVTQKLRSGYW